MAEPIKHAAHAHVLSLRLGWFYVKACGHSSSLSSSSSDRIDSRGPLPVPQTLALTLLWAIGAGNKNGGAPGPASCVRGVPDLLKIRHVGYHEFDRCGSNGTSVHGEPPENCVPSSCPPIKVIGTDMDRSGRSITSC